MALVYNKKLKFRTLFKVPKNLNMCPDVSGLCPSSVECSLSNDNEHSTDEGHSPETSGHMFKFFGTLNNVLNFNFLKYLIGYL